MYDRVIFYNHYGAGDIFESREFVKEWMRLVPSVEYFYSHGKNPRILLDMPKLQFKEPTVHMQAMRGVWDDLNGNLYVNTWIGRDGRYVLPGIGCTVEKLYDMHNDMLKVYKLGELSGEPIDYIPDIDYNKYNISDLQTLLSDLGNRSMVYIDNGLVQSSQAQNFDFKPIIWSIVNNHKDKVFLLSQPYGWDTGNVYCLSDYTGNVGFDLNEISFASTFCNVLIGRNSGPHVYTQVKRNVSDGNKKLLSFTYHHQGSSFVVNTDVSIQKNWSPATTHNEVVQEIERVIG
jgi:hypothetical protein